MAVSNSLVEKKENDKLVVEFESNGMQVKLTPAIVKNYMISGDSSNVTDQEIAMFMNLCKFSGLNPWLKEAYCIKFGSEPATLVVGKEAFQKRAENHPNFDGFEAGIIVQNTETGGIHYYPGTFKKPQDELLGGYATVWRKDRNHSIHIEVSFEEYAGRKKDGSLNKQWAKRPMTMIRKVALVQALREAFPGSLGGMYVEEEQNIAEVYSDVVDIETGEITEDTEKSVADALFEKGE